MKQSANEFKFFLYQFWLWNLILDFGTLGFVIYLLSLFPDVEKLFMQVYVTYLIIAFSFLRLLMIVIVAIIKIVKRKRVQFFCLLGEFIFLLLIFFALMWFLPFVLAGATSIAGS
ncbi:MAG: hypothetical protein JWP12_3235 [Bacteroidetes bacterium]|nr:hypothetical protein [Bacteroidota bacterium]